MCHGGNVLEPKANVKLWVFSGSVRLLEENTLDEAMVGGFERGQVTAQCNALLFSTESIGDHGGHEEAVTGDRLVVPYTVEAGAACRCYELDSNRYCNCVLN